MKSLFLSLSIANDDVVLRLMTADERRKFRLLVFLRVLSGVLDLIGLAFMGLVASALAATNQSASENTFARNLVADIGLESLSVMQQLMLFVGIAMCVFLAKGILATFINFQIFSLLGHVEASIGSRLLEAEVMNRASRKSTDPKSDIAYDLSTGVLAGSTRSLGYMSVFIGESVTVLLLGVAFLVIDPLTAIFTSGFFVAIGFFLHRLVSARAAQSGEVLSRTTSRSMQIVDDALSLSRELVLRNSISTMKFMYLREKEKATDSNAQLLTWTTVPRHVIETAMLLGISAMAILQFSMRDDYRATLGIGLFLVAGARIAPSVLSAQGAMAALHLAAAEGERAKARMAALLYEDNQQEGVRTHQIYEQQGVGLSVASLNVQAGSNLILKNVSFSLTSNCVMCVVGASGAGKTTLLDSLLGLTGYQGSVTLDGRSVMDWISKDPGSIGYVPQSSTILDASTLLNVSLAVDDANIAQVSEVLHRVRLDFLAEACAAGEDTLLGVAGRGLSGGESQRLSIARALYSGPRLIVMDEPTSALDAENETAILQLISELSDNAIIVMSAHRPAALSISDYVLELEDGAIKFLGSATEYAVRSRRGNDLY
jgi:ABC-type transport system involved in cytochrome bd biosynthesis fused ATPase/permease subunit